MGILRTFVSGLTALLRGRKLNQEMDEELRSYLDSAVEQKMRAGMTHSEALRAARVEIGSTDAVKQQVWSAGWESKLETIWQDVRYGLRVLRKSPGFTAVVIITLALGIGANTAIFSLINAIMLRTLPVSDPQGLVLLKWKAKGGINFNAHPNLVQWNGCPGNDPGDCSFSYPVFQQIEAQEQIFSGAFAFIEQPGSVMKANGRIVTTSGLNVSGGFFATLGVQPALGRLLVPSDDYPGANPVIVVSYRFWQNVLGGDRLAVGKSLLIRDTPFTIVGVTFPQPLQLDPGLVTDFWVPLSTLRSFARFKTDSNFFAFQVMARLRAGVSVAQATATVSTIFAASTTTGPAPMFLPNTTVGIELPTAAYGESSLRKEFSRSLYVLLAAVGSVLLIACANISGLMLARTSGRRRDIAVRSALGASRGRIIRQLLTESVLLSLGGGILGVVVGIWGAEALAGFLTRNLPSLTPWQVDAHPDVRVLSFTFCVSMIVGVVFGLLPAFSSRQVEVVPALKDGAASLAGSSHRSRGIVSHVLVVVQMALTVLVLAGAGLLVRTLANLKAVDLGFDPQNVLLFSIDSTYSNRTGGNLNLLHRELQEQLATLPGVTSASYSGSPLLSGVDGEDYSSWGGHVFAEDRPTSPINVWNSFIGSDFFKTMRIPLLAGRALNLQDLEEQTGQDPSYEHVVINEKLARLLFGNQPAVGRSFLMNGRNCPLSIRREVVGVVGNTKSDNLREGVMPMMYEPTTGGTFEVRTAGDPKALMPAVRTAVSRFDSNLLITDMKTQTEQIDHNIYQVRLIADLSSLFALLALIVACVGIYGLLSYQVTHRTQEIGIRLALGAQRTDVLRLVIRQGLLLAGIGALIGVAASLALTRYLQSFLFGVRPSDPVTIAAVAFGLIAVALLASYLPARRAMNTDPMVALRYE